MKFLSLISLITLATANGPLGKKLSPKFYLQAYGWNHGVRFEVTMPENTYLGFSFGKSSMWKTDMLIFQATTGKAEAGDYLGKGYKPPKKDKK